MANVNKVILIGNLTRDPQLKYTPSQMAIGEFGLAVNRKYKSADGQMKEDVCFVNCVAWGRQAETIQKYVTKGQQIYIEGRLHFQSWDGPDGKKRSKLEVTVEQFQFLGGGKGAGGAPGGGGGGAGARPAAPPSPDAQRQGSPGAEPPQQAPDYDFNQDVEDDTIPF